MLNYREILDYHLNSQKKDSYGFEFEIFCLNKEYQRVFYGRSTINVLRDIFNYLIKERGFKLLDYGKTIGVGKDGAKFTLEPGSQLEYSASLNKHPDTLLEEFRKLLEIYKEITTRFNIKFSDISLFPFPSAYKEDLLFANRYKVMREYFNNTDNLGKTMMLDTTCLQLTFGFDCKDDLEEKVNRLLFLKPVLLILSSSSRVYNGQDSGYHSFREIIWENVDVMRCGDPGEGFWSRGRWKLKDYIEKVLNAPVMFDVVKKRYKKTPREKFCELIDKVNIESYVFHNSTIFTDIRIKDYIELRYLDNPGILLTPGIMLFIENALNKGKFWEMIKKLMPYNFNQVPFMTRKMNRIEKDSLGLWTESMSLALITLLEYLKQNHSREFHTHFDNMIDKVNSISKSSEKKIDTRNILKEYTNQFDKNLIKILT